MWKIAFSHECIFLDIPQKISWCGICHLPFCTHTQMFRHSPGAQWPFLRPQEAACWLNKCFSCVFESQMGAFWSQTWSNIDHLCLCESILYNNCQITILCSSRVFFFQPQIRHIWMWSFYLPTPHFEKLTMNSNRLWTIKDFFFDQWITQILLLGV